MFSFTKYRLSGKTLFLIFTACFLSSALYSTIINIPADYTTIQAGIDASANADTVLVQPGTYVENIRYYGKLITLGSLFLTTQDEDYISSTIIDGNATSRVVSFLNGEDSSAILTGFTITNGSTTYGGGIYCNGASPTLKNLIITGNTATFAGGGISCYNCSPIFKNVEIVGNTANNRAGGVNCENNSTPTLENVTIVSNTAAYYGGAIFCDTNSDPIVINSILWDNSPEEIYLNFSSITVSYSDIEGGYTGTGNIDSDPLFVDPSNGDYHLTENSPCIDAGDPASPLDPDGTVADMGAYYYHQNFGPVIHISTTGSDLTGNGSEELPFATIQHGINMSANTDTVLVQPGTYVENINYNSKLITVGSLFLTTQDTSYISSTIIDGDSLDTVVKFESGEDSTTVLSGFTITNGLGIYASPNPCNGGGIYCYGSSPQLLNLIISNNYAVLGGGIGCNLSSPTIENVTISENICSNGGSGGGICFLDECSPSIRDAIITGNTADYDGGGIFVGDGVLSLENVTISNNISGILGGGIHFAGGSSGTLDNVIISYNTTTEENAAFQYSGGAGIFFWGVNLILNNVTISHNEARQYMGDSYDIRGGGIYVDGGGNVILENVTVSDNSSWEYGGGIYSAGANTSLKNVIIFCNFGSVAGEGIYVDGGNVILENVTMSDNYGGLASNGIDSDGGSISIINSIIWDNISVGSSSVDITYSDILCGYAGVGNIDTDPLFVAGYHLQSTSPCIDAGNPDPQYDDPDGTIADMGAYYFHHLAPPSANFTVDTLTGYSLFNFTDLTRHGSGVLDEWYWDFGDGNNSSLQNPAHEYLSGVYTVALTVTSDDDSTDTEIKVDYITVYSTDAPASPTDLQIDITGDDAILTWSVVDTTFSGYPSNVTAYIVYNSLDPYSNFSFEGFIADTCYTHQFVSQFSDRMFYQVSAYVGELRLLQSVITENPNFKIGELDSLIEEKRIRINKSSGNLNRN
jgi:predicted outer membrane repeat protein